MHWIAPSEKDTDNAALEKRLWDAAEQAVPAPHFAETDFNSARAEGLLGLIFLRFAEVRFAAQRARLESPSPLGAALPSDGEDSVNQNLAFAHQDRRVGGPGLQRVGPVPPPGAASTRAGGEGYSGDPSKELSIHGVEKTDETGRLCRLNLAVHGLEGDIRHGGPVNSYYDDPHAATGRFDFVLANPPFNVNAVDKERLKDMVGPGRRFPFGLPRTDNATATRVSAKTKLAKPDRRSVGETELHYLWIQLFHSALNEKGRAGFVMANSASDARSSEQELRRQLIESRAVDVMVAVGPNLFYTVTLPCTLWFLDKSKAGRAALPRGPKSGTSSNSSLPDRSETVLFIDARHIYRQVDRAHREWTPAQIGFLANLVRLYRGESLDFTLGGDEARAKLEEIFGVAQVSKPAVSPISKSAGRGKSSARSSGDASAGLETGDTADSEVCATVAYDGLMENSQRRIRILEAMARALYREGFVHFRFPGHEKLPRVASPLGDIPQGWEVKKLADVAEVNRAQINARTAPEELHYIDISSVSSGQNDSITTYAFADAPGRARRIVQHGDVLWSCVRPNRRSHAQVMHPEPDTIASIGFAVLTATKVPFTFLYFATTTDDFVAFLTNNATGAAYPAVSGATFEKADLLIPPDPLLKKFGDATIPMAEQIHTLQRQIQNLRRPRDLLLPRLLSGQATLPHPASPILRTLTQPLPAGEEMGEEYENVSAVGAASL